MGYYTNETRENDALKEAETLRLAASQIHRIKKVILENDGKIYNCRFDEAIKKLNTENARFSSSVNSYGYYTLNIYLNNKYITLISCKKATKGEETTFFTDSKRIKADAMSEYLTNKYGELLKRAAEIENAIQNINIYISQLETLKKSINNIISGIPSEVSTIYNLKHIY